MTGGGTPSPRATELAAVGLGLAYDGLALTRTRREWLERGAALCDDVSALLGHPVIDVQHVGSSAVPGLLAKPIIDLAVGVDVDVDDTMEPLRSRLESEGWIYRGNAGDDGGHVLVLESEPWFRVAHLHVVEHDGAQWVRYLRFRDLLRASAAARSDYEAVKRRLLVETAGDRAAYTRGKTDVVHALLGT